VIGPAFLAWNQHTHAQMHFTCTWECVLEWQAGRCALCGDDRGLIRDHDHVTGSMRGGLCRSCNTHEGMCKNPQCRCVLYRAQPPATFFGVNVRYPLHPEKTVHFLTREESRELISAGSKRAPTGLRNRAMIAVMYGAGLKLTQTLRLRPEDVDYQVGTVKVGGRALTISDEWLGHLSTWANERHTLGLEQSSGLFCTLDGGTVSSRYVRAMCERYARRAGIKKRVHPGALRHAHAAELQQQGHSIRYIQARLGHASLAITEYYLTHLGEEAS